MRKVYLWLIMLMALLVLPVSVQAREVIDVLKPGFFSPENSSGWAVSTGVGTSGAAYTMKGANNSASPLTPDGKNCIKIAGASNVGGIWVTEAPAGATLVKIVIHRIGHSFAAGGIKLFGNEDGYSAYPTATLLKTWSLDKVISSLTDLTYEFDGQKAFAIVTTNDSPESFSSIEVVWSVADSEAPKTPKLFNGTEEVTGNATFTENTQLKVSSEGASKIKITGAVTETIEKSSYTFPLTASGTYTFTGENPVGVSTPLTLTLTVGTPQQPVLTVGDNVVASGSTTGSKVLKVSSQYATTITVTGPQGYSVDIEGSEGAVTLAEAGKYTIVGKNSKQQSMVAEITLVMPRYRQATLPAQLVKGSTFIIGCEAENIVMSAETKTANSVVALWGKSATIAGGSVSTLDAVRLILHKVEEEDEFTGIVTDTYYTLMTEEGDKGLYLDASGANANITTRPSKLDISFDAQGNAAILLKGTTRQLHVDTRAAFAPGGFTVYPNPQDSRPGIQLFTELTEEIVPDAPVFVMDGEIISGECTVKEGTAVTVSSVGAESLRFTTPGAQTQTIEGPTYTFNVTKPGTYKAVGVNAKGNSAETTVTVTIPGPATPVVYVDNKATAESTIFVSGSTQIKVVSENASMIAVTSPSGATQEIEGDTYTFTPDPLGTYTFTGKTSTQTSSPVTVTFKAEIYSLVTDIDEIDEDGTYIVVYTGLAERNNAASTPTVMTNVNTNVLPNAGTVTYYGMTYSTDIAFLNDTLQCIPPANAQRITFKPGTAEGSWKIMTGDDKGFYSGLLSGETTSRVADISLRVLANPSDFNIEFVEDGNGLVNMIPLNNSGKRLGYMRDRGYLTLISTAWFTPKLYKLGEKSDTADTVPMAPTFVMNGTTLSETCAVAEGSEITVKSKGATSIRFTAPGAAPATVDGNSYTFAATKAGVYTAVGINATGESAMSSLTVSLLAPATPVVYVDDFETSESTVYIGASTQVKVVSENASLIKVVDPSGQTQQFEGNTYIFHPEALGKYSFTGITPTQTSETISITFKAEVYTRVTNAYEIEEGATYIVVYAGQAQNNRSPEPANVMTTTNTSIVTIPGTTYKYYGMTYSNNVTFLNDSMQCIPPSNAQRITFKKGSKEGTWKILTAPDKAFYSGFLTGESSPAVSPGSLRVLSLEQASDFTLDFLPETNGLVNMSATTNAGYRIGYMMLTNGAGSGWMGVIPTSNFSPVLYRLGEEKPEVPEFTSLSEMVEYGKSHGGATVKFVGAADVTGCYGNEIWLESASDSNKGYAYATAASVPSFLTKDWQITNFEATLSSVAPYTVVITSALTENNCTSTNKFADIPVVENINTTDFYRLVQLAGNVSFTETGGTLTTATDDKVTLLNNLVDGSSKSAKYADDSSWKPGTAWPTGNMENVYVAGYVMPGEDGSSVVLRVARISDRLITGVDDIENDVINSITFDGQILTAPAGTRVFTLDGRAVVAEKAGEYRLSAKGVHIVVLPNGKTLKLMVK